MRSLSTLSGRATFRFKGSLGEELIVYPADESGRAQDKYAIAITHYTIELVKSVIREKLLMGASRDNPPKGSLGEVLKSESQTPQQLSYLIPILIETGFCDYVREGNAFVIRYKRE